MCNPITRNHILLPLHIHPPPFGSLAGAQLCLDPTASSHFHVIEYLEVEDYTCADVQIYSSATPHTWIYIVVPNKFDCL